MMCDVERVRCCDVKRAAAVKSSRMMLIRCPAGASNIHGRVFVPQPMLDCVDQLSTPAAAAAAAMCSGLDVTDTTQERSGSTTVNQNKRYVNFVFSILLPRYGSFILHV